MAMKKSSKLGNKQVGVDNFNLACNLLLFRGIIQIASLNKSIKALCERCYSM